MNLYLRYFNKETLVKSADEAIDFLAGISEISMNPELEADIREYANSDVAYPKRYKVRPRVYFIIIKTEAKSMQDFKDKKALRGLDDNGMEKERKTAKVELKLNEIKYGWYEGTMDFKRVQMVPGTNKFQYRDTHFVAQLKAESPMDCYNRIVEHLRQRVDERSQFPSAKGKNFKYTFLGTAK
jgi:broad specificity phosphatase PhoE